MFETRWRRFNMHYYLHAFEWPACLLITNASSGILSLWTGFIRARCVNEQTKLY